VARVASGHSSAVQSRLAARSVEIILDSQAASGAYPASPSFSQYRDFCWFRDGAFIAEAMSRVGETESAERFFDWCAEIVRRVPAGPWDSRYRLDGSSDPVSWWPHRQFDGLGLWVWAMKNHIERHRVASRWSDAAEATQVFLAEHWSEPCHDWWEERSGVHAATLGCVWAALPRDDIASGARAARERERLDGSHAFLVVLGLAGVDVLAQLERTLGYHRHLEDEYYGGGEWPVIAGLVGWARLVNGLDPTPQRAWIESHAESGGALPEQAGEQLRPSFYGTWVARWGPPASPLLWSHAMYLIVDALLTG
jgi:GH15 family glucan-1,4-alpha-glucosidase